MSKIVAEIFFVLGVLLAAFFVWQLVKGVRARKWPTTEGRVLESQVTKETSYDDGSSSTTYGAEITYRYEVDGEEYSGKRRSFADYRSSNRRRAVKIVARYAPGAVIMVYYRPDQPDESVLEPGMSAGFFLFLILPLTFMAIGVAGLLGLM
jgi:hypothetical protein